VIPDLRRPAAGPVAVSGGDRELGRIQRGRVGGTVPLAATWLGAALVLVSGLVHLHLWDIAYRHVATLGPLFLTQFVLSVLGAVALVALRREIVVLAVAALMAGTLVGFVLALTTGLFGFKLGFVSGWADLALACEGGAVVLLSLAGGLTWALVRRAGDRETR
jgi:hypothetical protein